MTFLNSYNPDVLSCLANLSSDEVFTSPKIANEMLDLLPMEIWSDKNATFLDPCCKSGVFLREISKRLIKGLENEFPILEERLNHIYSKQIFGLGITELTALLSRRSVYCSRNANSKYSILDFYENEEGNIFYTKNFHNWKNGNCTYCGANENEYTRDNSLETYAYQFIHDVLPDKIKDMRFDVIIGNPPYQLKDSGAQASAIPIYNKFVEQAKKLNPRYLTMIIPSRWFAGGKGLDNFRESMLGDGRIRELHDYPDAKECFPGVDIKGGVCYFLWDREKPGICKFHTHSEGKIISVSERSLLQDGSDVLIRYNEAIPILNKVLSKKESSFSDIVSARKPFGLPTNFSHFKKDFFPGAIKIYANQKTGYVTLNQVERNHPWVDGYKIYIPKAIGAGNVKEDWVKPILGEPKTCCTETYLLVGPFKDRDEASNAITYTQTKFFHFLLSLKKITQDTTNKVYSFIPIQDFSEPWDDEKLYNKYGFNSSEVGFIESMVRPGK